MTPELLFEYAFAISVSLIVIGAGLWVMWQVYRAIFGDDDDE